MNNQKTMLPTSTIGKTSLTVTRLGFGAASIGNLFQDIARDEAEQALTAALDAGLNYFDTAPFYGFGLSERRLGDVVRDLPSRPVISTKAGRLIKPISSAGFQHNFVAPLPFEPVYDYSYDGVMRSFEDSLQRLGLPQVDMLFLHDIGSLIHGEANQTLFKIAMDGGYRALDELRSQGMIQAIGLGVNEYEVCEDAMRYGDFDCFLLAGRYTLLEQTALATFLPECERRHVSVVIGGPYNSGILAKGTQAGQTPTYNYAPAPPEVVAKVARLEAICAQFGVPLAAAALQFSLAHPAVAAVIPGISSAGRMHQALEQFHWSIPTEFWSALKNRGLIREETPLPT